MHLFAVVVLYIVAQVVVALLAQLLFAVDSVAVVLLLWLHVYMGALCAPCFPLPLPLSLLYPVPLPALGYPLPLLLPLPPALPLRPLPPIIIGSLHTTLLAAPICLSGG